MIWASRWSVALRTFYRQILSVLYSSYPFGNFRPRLVRAVLVLMQAARTLGTLLISQSQSPTLTTGRYVSLEQDPHSPHSFTHPRIFTNPTRQHIIHQDFSNPPAKVKVGTKKNTSSIFSTKALHHCGHCLGLCPRVKSSPEKKMETF